MKKHRHTHVGDAVKGKERRRKKKLRLSVFFVVVSVDENYFVDRDWSFNVRTSSRKKRSHAYGYN
jgi:hypothetical protein